MNLVRTFRYPIWLVLASILLLGLGLRAWSLDFGLPFRYNVDEPAYVIAALRIAQGKLQLNYPPMSPSFQQLLYVVLYGLFFMAKFLTGAVASPNDFAKLYEIDPTPFYLLARSVSVVSSLISISLLFAIVRRLRELLTAALATLFLAVCFLDVRHAHFVEPYSLVTMMALACVYAALRCGGNGEPNGRKWLIASGLTCGVAVGIRYSVLPLGLVPLFAVGTRWFGSGPDRRLRALAIDFGWIALAGGFGLLIGVPGLIVNLPNTLAAVRGQSSLAGSLSGFFGITFTDLPTWRFYLAVLEIAWGIPLLIAIALGVMHVIAGRSVQDRLFLVFPLFYGLELSLASASSSAFARYLLPALPFMAFLAADGFMVVLRWLGSRLPERYFPALLGVTSLVLVAIPLMRGVKLDRLWTIPDTRTQAKAWIEANLPVGTHLATQWHGPPLSTATDSEPRSQRTYDLKLLYPFSADEDLDTLEFYQDEGFEYLVLSSYIYNLKLADSGRERIRQRFYHRLDQEAKLVAEFKPYQGEGEPPFLFEQIWGPITHLWDYERPGPTIKIYRLGS